MVWAVLALVIGGVFAILGVLIAGLAAILKVWRRCAPRWYWVIARGLYRLGICLGLAGLGMLILGFIALVH